MTADFRRSPENGITVRGALSGRCFVVPDANSAPMPDLAAPGVILNGEAARSFGRIDGALGYPDVQSFRRKFALLVPATNTAMEAELWRLLVANQNADGLDGIGLHTVPVATPRPVFRTAEDLELYKADFLAGLHAALGHALMAEPQHVILGMSLEHVVDGLAAVRASTAEMEATSGLGWSLWQDAAKHALDAVGARRIGLLTPFDANGNRNAERLFRDLGYEVVCSVGFSCANALHIAHLPDWAKERAIVELLATPGNRLDAVVQCGTNMSLSAVAERVEARIGIPILGINATLLWHALRENGFPQALRGAGRLLRQEQK